MNQRPGLAQHGWPYLSQCYSLKEIAHKIVHEEVSIAYRNLDIKAKYDAVVDAYGSDIRTEHGDFSERLLTIVEAVTSRKDVIKNVMTTPMITELIYTEDIGPLQKTIDEYLHEKDGLWILIDNIDKGWPVKGATSEDIMILRCLLEATRKIQRRWERKNLEFRTIVFIRNDINEQLFAETPDRGKDTIISLDWSDVELFKEIIRLRLTTTTEIEEKSDIESKFEDIWSFFFDSHVQAEDSFRYMLNRTMMRPREIIRFVQKAVETAVNRNHYKVFEEDILHAEIAYSDDSFHDIIFELKDMMPEYYEVLYDFIGCKSNLLYSEVVSIIKIGCDDEETIGKIIDFLVWLGFLGVKGERDKVKYSYNVQYNIHKLRINDRNPFVIHPAFRRAIECNE